MIASAHEDARRDEGGTTYTVTITVSTRCARLWIGVMGFLAPIIGVERAERWAVAGVWRFSRYRVGTGPWLRFSGETRDQWSL